MPTQMPAMKKCSFVEKRLMYIARRVIQTPAKKCWKKSLPPHRIWSRFLLKKRWARPGAPQRHRPRTPLLWIPEILRVRARILPFLVRRVRIPLFRTHRAQTLLFRMSRVQMRPLKVHRVRQIPGLLPLPPKKPQTARIQTLQEIPQREISTNLLPSSPARPIPRLTSTETQANMPLKTRAVKQARQTLQTLQKSPRPRRMPGPEQAQLPKIPI